MSKLPLIGADPEFFIKDIRGRIIPSCDLIGGAKDSPVKIPESHNESYKWLEDNVAVELNYPPAPDADTFTTTTYGAIVAASVSLKKRNLFIDFSATHKFPKDMLKHPKAMSIGCKPDRCAYDGDKKRVVDIQDIKDLRFTGGHIHLAYDHKERIPSYAVAMLLDFLVGMPSIMLERQGERRKYYGLAGLYRKKDYGIEYRTLSNWWLRDNARRALMANAVLSVGRAIADRPLELSNLFNKIPFRDVQTAINTEDVSLAREVASYIRWSKNVHTSGVSFDLIDMSGLV